MKFKFEKNLRIITDLVSYCYRMGSMDYHLDIKLRKNMSVYMLNAPAPKMTKQDADDLMELLNTPRQHELEQNFWALSGDSENNTEMALVGMMIDSAMVDLTDGMLTIVAKRLEEAAEA